MFNTYSSNEAELKKSLIKKLIRECNQISITKLEDTQKILFGIKLADNKRDPNTKSLTSPKNIIEKSVQ
jgi:hypothetical protein